MPRRSSTKVDRKNRRPARSEKSRPGLSTAAVRRRARPVQEPDPEPRHRAMAGFERAMASLQRHRYDDAAGAFRALIEEHPAEGALIERARVYLELCERETGRRLVEPGTREERLTAATAALNDADDARAERLVRHVLREDPRHELALYLLAAVEARRGRVAEALERLGEAVAVSPEVTAQARHDPDFRILRDSPTFQELTQVAPSGSRRTRRARAER
jgi:predicted Zn-dependent protease